METNNEKFSLSGKTNPISSRSDYFGNTNKSNGNDLYKVLLLSVLFVIAIVLIYNTCKNNTPASPISINENDGKKDTPIVSQPEIPVTVPVKDTIVLVKKDKKRVRVSASDLEGLRRKLLSSSISALRSGNYTPANLRVNLNTFSASFDLDPVPSDFIKLSLVWGPLNVGCESCVNSLQKNPGSVQMFSAQDNTYEYGVIAIAN